MQRFPLLVVLLVAGCQDTSGVFKSSTGAGGAGTTTSGKTTGATSTHASTSTHGATTTGSSTQTGSSTGASTSVASSSSSGGMPPFTYCNGAPCAPGQVCCYSNTLAGLDKCSSSGCTAGFVALKCNGPADCPGGECCAKYSNTSGWQGSECKTSCANGERVMCYGNASVCMSNQSCVSDPQLGMGYAYCTNGGG